MNYTILEDLNKIPSPSGYEEEMCKYISNINLKNFEFTKYPLNSCSYIYNANKKKKNFINRLSYRYYPFTYCKNR